jgi:transposase-like protein
MGHSVEFRAAAVQKYLTRGNRTVGQITDELGINIQTIYYWRNQLAKVGGMNKKSKPHTRSSTEKLKALIEYDALEVEKRGEYLRKNGLHVEHLNAWRKQIEDALSPIKKTFLERNELIAEQKKVEKLQKEIRRKDSALAEASALLILKKKADLIWGSEEDE